MDSYLAVMNQIHILLVDHELLAMNTIRLLEECYYRELAMGATQMLRNGKLKFDFIIANVNSPDAQAFSLLEEATKMNTPIIMMSTVADDDTLMAMKVIEIGAFLYIKRPTVIETMRYLWQHVARDNMRVMTEQEPIMATTNYIAPRGIETSYGNPSDNQLMMMTRERGKLKRNYDKGRGVDEGEYEPKHYRMSHGKVKRKICTEWTQELHQKFIDAVQQLGEGRCFPKEILELMNEPELTRMQVASHLQKCRNANWRSPHDRKSSLGAGLSSPAEGGSNQKPRRFGSMPPIVKLELGQSSKTNSHSEMIETVMGNQASFHQHYGRLVPHPHATNPSPAPATADDDLLNLQDIGCLIQSGLPPSNDNPQSASTNFQFVPVYTHDQTNSKGASMESKSPWPTSSETSNFCSGDSETKTS